MTVEQLLANISSMELTKWKVHFKLLASEAKQRSHGHASRDPQTMG